MNLFTRTVYTNAVPNISRVDKREVLLEFVNMTGGMIDLLIYSPSQRSYH